VNATDNKQQGWVAVTLAVILVIVLAAAAYYYQQYRSQLVQSQQNLSVAAQIQERVQTELNTVQLRFNEANSRVQQLESERSRLITDAEANSAQLTSLQAEYDELRQDAQSSVGDLQTELEEARRDRDELEQILAEADGLLSLQAEQQARLEAEQAETIRILAKVEAELVGAEQRLANGDAELVNAEQRLANGDAELVNAEQRLDESNAELQLTRAELVSTRQEVDDLNRQLADSQAVVQRLLIERTSLLAKTQNMEQESRELQAVNSRLQEQLDTVLSELNVVEVELMRREANLDQAVAERETVEDEYRQAREQLALQQARNQNYTETIDELEARLNLESTAMNELQEQLQLLSNERQTLVSRLEDGTTVIKLPESIVFASGSADIGDSGRETLQLLADALVSFPDHLISIQGHSDSRSISATLQEKYPSNWELSTARAASAVQVLGQSGIQANRMQAVGYADTRPLVEETNAQSRRTNRRIEVLLYPNQFTMRVLDQAAVETP